MDDVPPSPARSGTSEGAQPPDPARTLERIAYLLERSGAPTYRVRAFRTAVGVLRQLTPEQVATLSRSRRLTDLPGIGDTTSRVVAEVLEGRVPEYLVKLEETITESGRDPNAMEDPGVTELLGMLQGDCHSHSDWSDGGSPIATMAEAARDLGRRYLALTDHSPRLTVANGLSTERLLRQLQVVDEVNKAMAPFRLLTGIEVDITEDGELDQDDELLSRLDVVVASVHSKLRMDAEPMTARMLAAVRNPRVDILGHCTGRIVVGRGRPPSSFDAAVVFAACAESDTAVEINARPERLDPPDELLTQAVAAGCLFSIDTDAHAPGQLEWLVNGARKAVACAVPAERIVTTWEAERLLGWTRAS
ncbi:MAG: PHP domain-containing protein [Acidimicrobiaceae bacterium]|nr:PHP domain-containing protein [Acidimicrobiaceae bacterium]